MSLLLKFYEKAVLDRTPITLALILTLSLLLGWFAKNLEIDISTDSLLLENDADLAYYEAMTARYSGDDFLVITYTPNGRKLFHPESLADLRTLRNEVDSMERVKSVVSILDVPLIQSPPITFAELDTGIRTLDDPRTNLQLAEKELRNSPLYRDRLVGATGETTAIQVNFLRDATYQRLQEQRKALRMKKMDGGLTDKESLELEKIAAAFNAHKEKLTQQEQQDIAHIRALLERHRGAAQMHLGGVPMIVTDIMHYVRSDLRVFGVAVLVVMALILAVAFGRLRWVVISVITALATAAITTGFMTLVHWPITVVSSNFIALLLIFVLSLTIHLIVRFQELHRENPQQNQRWLVQQTMRSKATPSFYMVITTMVAFGSLVVSGIRPVIDFGWMMCLSLTVALILNFTLFPALLMRFPLLPSKKRSDVTGGIMAIIPSIIERMGWGLMLGFLILVGLGMVGVSQLSVENRFIDHFKADTEIHQGMLVIDRALGGTMSLDVIIDPPAAPPAPVAKADSMPTLIPDMVSNTVAGMEDMLKGEINNLWGDDTGDSLWASTGLSQDAGITGRSHWYNSMMAPEVIKIHRWLDQLKETGKVISLASTLEVLSALNAGQLPDDITLSIIHKKLTPEVKEALFTPFLSEDGNQLRFSVRVYESDPTLKRDLLLKKIRHGLVEDLGLKPEQIHVNGMLVLYNNMLQSLFHSQITTLGAVMVAILLMFMALFRSVKLAIIAIIPNLVSIPLVLGSMGALGIPLDIMTITIAAISIGIGVDDTIHYIYRFGHEIRKDGDYPAAVRRAHSSIGRALYYTTVTIAIGFSVLTLSQFVPTIYFGFLTACSMLVALLANLTLLPLLLEKIRPYRL
ncbi:putative integral membrane protein [Magnetococcus marinus MC-1]|uniref:Putative integral membrane protein n=1 Tax=Magnetococcus marinus (strain ATCC BAA-1437 / JCM 17883 / MC-1) TaxID=156889 RepID=A0L7T5_MAGMM|nr:MMPL family transporter [Magnetococcus marinus]ABK44028.1 putative integral membrane protein [Magnetococcus marinus MC-1]